MQNMYELAPPSPALRQAITALCECDPDFLGIETQAGPVTVLSLPPNFAALVRLIVAQQLSTQVARAIYQKLTSTVSLEPNAFLSVSEETLKAAGLSRAKILSCQSLAQALEEGTLDLTQCGQMEEAALTAQLTAIRGIGPWTAELFLLFALEKPDIFPAGDLAIQRGYQSLKQWETAPGKPQLIQAAEMLRPYRSAAAHLLWHYYRHLNHPTPNAS